MNAICAGPGTNKGLWTNDTTLVNSGEAYEISTAGAVTPVSIPETQVGRTDDATSIVSDLNGKLWYTRPSAADIGMFDPATGLITEFPVNAGNARPTLITLDPVTGWPWFVAQIATNANAEIGKVDPNTGALTIVGVVPKSDPSIRAITFDAKDGNFWYVDDSHASIGFINPTTGAITENIALSVDSGLNDIVADASGNLWFTDSSRVTLGEYVLATSTITYPKNAYVGNADQIIVDSQGNFWFIGGSVSGLFEFNPVSGTLTEVDPYAGGSIALGPDGNIWFAGGQDIVGVYNVTNGQITTYPVPSQNPGAFLYAITAGEDGNVWFTGQTFGSAPINFIGAIGLTSAAQPSSLAIATQPGHVTAGHGFGLAVAVDNSSGSLDLFYQGTVSLSLATDPSGNAKLGGTLTATVVNGEAVFTGLTLNNAGTGYVIQATATGITPALTQPFDVALPATHLVVTTEPPVSVAAGTEFTTVVAAEDDNGNVDGTYDQAITLTLLNNTEAATFGGTLTEVPNDGMATFSDLTVSQPGDGYALQAAGGTLATGQSSDFDVTAPPANHLVMATGPPDTMVAGTPFELVVDADDNLGLLDTTYNGPMTLSLSGGPSQATLGGTLQVNAAAGVATFSGLTLDLAGSNYTINVASGTLTGVSTSVFVVTPAAAYQLLISTQPSSMATAGQPFATQPVISEVDEYGNLETGDDSTAITVSLATGNGPLQGTAMVTESGGVAAFTDLADDRAGVISLNFAGLGLLAGPSSNIFISPAAAAQLVIQTPPFANVTAGNPLTDPIVIDEEDQYGNRRDRR